MADYLAASQFNYTALSSFPFSHSFVQPALLIISAWFQYYFTRMKTWLCPQPPNIAVNPNECAILAWHVLSFSISFSLSLISSARVFPHCPPSFPTSNVVVPHFSLLTLWAQLAAAICMPYGPLVYIDQHIHIDCKPLHVLHILLGRWRSWTFRMCTIIRCLWRLNPNLRKR